MNISEILEVSRPVMPVLVISKLEQAVPLAEALVNGGARVLEITLRTEDSLAAIEVITTAMPELVVGAGSVIEPGQVAQARQAGASFIVSPGFSIEVIEACREQVIPVLPGVMTPSEVMTARAAGLRYLKLFPAEIAGGVSLLKAMSGPLADMSFCPTGGISEDSYQQYLDLANVSCVGGSWLAPQALVERGEWSQITEMMLRLRQK